MRVRLIESINWDDPDRALAPDAPEVLLTATDDDSFSALIDRALERLDSNATVVPYYPDYEEGAPPLRATLVRLGPAGTADRSAESDYVHEDPWYGVHDDGSVYRVEAHYPRPVRLGDLLRAAAAGYSDRDFLDVLVSEHPGGYGGDGDVVANWVAFLGGIGVEVGTNLVTDGIKFGAKNLLLHLRGLRLRRVSPIALEAAAAWEANGFSYARELRDLLDKKTAWTEKEVAKRLKVSVSTARQLLFALGHDPDGTSGTWTRTDRPPARRRRHHWMKKEFQQTMGPYWRKYWKSSQEYRA